MDLRLVFALLLAGSIGCGQKADSSGPESKVGTNPNRETASHGDDAQIAAAIAELTQAVRKYGVEQRSAPKSLDELVSRGYLSRVPPAPAGKKFAINKKLEVYLASE